MSSALLNIAKRAAEEAGKVIYRGFQQRNMLSVAHKSANDYVTEYDRLAQEVIINTIKKYRPREDYFVGEEDGLDFVADKAKQPGVVTWIIDPIDGTRNFMLGQAHFAISICALEHGVPVAAVVFNPITDEMWTAIKGQGAQLNGERIRLKEYIKGTGGLRGKVMATGFAFKEPTCLDRQFQILKQLFDQNSPNCIGDLRRGGSAALDLCYVASGRVDGFYEEGVKSWDIAGGCLIVQEAGGFVMDFEGGFNHLSTGEVVAGPVEMCRQLLQEIKRATNTTQKGFVELG